MVLLQIYITLSFFAIKQFLCLEIIPERAVVKYINTKYIKWLKVTAMKRSRHSPYYINWDGVSKSQFGNNATVTLKLDEYLSGRWVPTPLLKSFKLCEFFEKEPYLGQMYDKQLKTLMPNWSCPLPPGEYHAHKLELHMEDFPFNIPFTWASVTVKTRGHADFFVTKTREMIAIGAMDFTITQKPHKIKRTKTNANAK